MLWGFINLKFCQNLCVCLKTLLGLGSVCVFFAPFSICYSCPLEPPVYTNNDNFVQTHSSPSLPDLQNWKFSSQIFLLQLTDKLKVVREQVSCEGDRDDGVEAGEEMVEEVEVITGWFSYKVSIIG